MAVLVAVVANFILGFLVHAHFWKSLGKEMGQDPNEKPKSSDMMRGLLFMVIGNFLMAYVFAYNIAAWSFVPDMENMSATGNILNSAIFTWFGFYLLRRAGWHRMGKEIPKLFFINTGYHLASLLVVATILIILEMRSM